MHPFTERKIALKELAKRIRTAKRARKNANYAAQQEAIDLGFEFRVAHIAYCLARGREMEDIELKVRPENKLTEYWLKRIDDTRAELASRALAYEEKRQEVLAAAS